MMYRAHIVFALSMLVCPFASSPLAAQADKCPAVGRNDWQTLAAVASVFQDSARAGFRTAFAISQVPLTAPKNIVTNDKACRVLAKATLKSLNRVFQITDENDAKAILESHDMEFFRIGSYYAVLLSLSEATQKKAGILVNGYSDLLIFRDTSAGDSKKVEGHDADHDDKLSDKDLQYVSKVLM